MMIPSLKRVVAAQGLACRNIGSGRKRATFWHKLGFLNLVLARAAKAKKRRLYLLEEWKREELHALRSRSWMSRPVSSGQRTGEVIAGR